MEKLTIGNKYLFDTCVFIDILNKRNPPINFYHQTRFLNVFCGYSIISESELFQWPGITGLRTEYNEALLLKAYHRYFINVTIARDAGRFSRKLHQDFLALKEKLKKEHKQPTDKDFPPGMPDCLIAATAKFYDLRLVTRDTDMLSFKQFGVIIDIYNITK